MLMLTQLSGFGIIAAQAPVLTTVAQQASAISTSVNVTCPTVIAGDVILLLDFAVSFSSVTKIVPSGFTEIRDNSTSTTRQVCSYKIANGTESGSSLSGMAGSLATRKVVVTFRGDIPISVVTPLDVEGQATTGNPTAQTVNASGQPVPLIVIGGYSAGSGTVDPRTFSPAKDGEVNQSGESYIAWKIYNSSPANVSIDMDDEGTNLLTSFYMTLA